jgi:hypothetical protein
MNISGATDKVSGNRCTKAEKRATGMVKVTSLRVVAEGVQVIQPDQFNYSKSEYGIKGPSIARK